jgi:hypothetical protein
LRSFSTLNIRVLRVIISCTEIEGLAYQVRNKLKCCMLSDRKRNTGRAQERVLLTSAEEYTNDFINIDF